MMLRPFAIASVISLAASALPRNQEALLKKYLEDPNPSAAEVKKATWLLHHGLSFKTVSPRGYTTVMFAARWGNIPLLKEAVRAKVDVDAHTFDQKWTALMVAVPEATRILLDAGADPNAQDSIGRTPLMWAALSKSRKRIELLISHGAKPEMKNSKGYSALTYAQGSPSLQALLRKSGAR